MIIVVMGEYPGLRGSCDMVANVWNRKYAAVPYGSLTNGVPQPSSV